MTSLLATRNSRTAQGFGRIAVILPGHIEALAIAQVVKEFRMVLRGATI
jgi:hypothetical protein